jgi:hypothetical protein
MPGIYINDGGQTSSTLGNILGGIAANVGPEAAAKAQLLYQQTQGQDLTNQDVFEAQRAREISAQQTPGLTRTLQMNAPDPGAPAGSVPATAAAIAIPPPSATPGPGGRISRIDESGFTPEQAYLANEIVAGRLPPSALQTGVDVFQTPLVGAGNVPGVERAIATAQGSPQHIGTGDTLLIDPRKGNVPGNVVVGGSSYVNTGENAGATSDNDLAQKDSVLGATATGNLGTAQSLEKLYDDTVAAGNANPLDVAGTQLGRRISEALGIDVDKIAGGMDGVKAEIANRYQAMFGNLRDNQGNPLVRGGGPGVTAQFPDADSNPNTFHRMSASLKATLNHQIEDGQAADAYLHNRRTMGPQAGDVYRQQRGANAAAEAKAQAAIGASAAGGGGLRAPTQQELDDYHTAVQGGRDPKELKEIFRVRHHVDPTLLN